jgi:hypothetical protein
MNPIQTASLAVSPLPPPTPLSAGPEIPSSGPFTFSGGIAIPVELSVLPEIPTKTGNVISPQKKFEKSLDKKILNCYY